MRVSGAVDLGADCSGCGCGVGVVEPVGDLVQGVPGDAEGDPAVLVGAVRERVATQLARFKQPGRVEVVETLPTTASGRVQKGRLRGIERRRALGLLD